LVARALLLLAILEGSALAWEPLWADWSWQDQPCEEPIALNAESFPLAYGTPAEWEGQYLEAVEVWNTQTGAAFAWNAAGRTYNGTTGPDGESVARFERSPAQGATIALASVWSTDDRMEECDIRFYGENHYQVLAWSTDPAGAPQGAFDFQRLAIHELGHCVGLGHSSDSDAVMFPYQNPGTGPSARNLGTDDAAGVLALYGVRSGAVLVRDGVTVVDDGTVGSIGDSDGAAQAGERVALVVDLANIGTESAYAVAGTLVSTEPRAQVVSGVESWGTVVVGASASGENGVLLDLDSDCTADFVAPLEVEIADDAGDAWTHFINLPVDCPGALGPLPEVAGLEVDDDQIGWSDGNGDGIPQIGEPLNLRVRLHNAGEEAATYVTGTLGTNVPWVNLYAVEATWGYFGPGQIVAPDRAFSLRVESGCGGAETAPMVLFLEDVGGEQWETPFDLVIECAPPLEPMLELVGFRWDDGDNGVVERGDEVDLWVEVENTGDGGAAFTGSLATDDADLVVRIGARDWPLLDPGERAENPQPFKIDVDAECEVDFTATLDLRLTTEVGYVFHDDLSLDVDCDLDEDGDGHPASVDCDDLEPAAYPGATEVCDGIDNDCDGDADTGAVDAGTWYPDADSDGFGDPSEGVVACLAPEGHISEAGDCDDDNVDALPGGVEVCDGADNDCDGSTDGPDALDAGTWYPDADGDGFGAPSPLAVGCDAPSGHVAGDGDCDDEDGAAHPDAIEACDGRDTDCDGEVDEGLLVTWYLDTDGDGFGDPAAPVTACEQPEGTAAHAGDCDDNDSLRHADCDSQPPEESPECGCSTSGGGRAWLLVLGMIALRRRQKRRS
jgi:MYXO-CTERM domain-containing protein